ncbi:MULTISPECIES: maleylacetoacetate isomerase [Methylobacterium]|uniref:Maleylpyruvate isomerase n=2 Tax=Pseudomonadota TaxID=1224 RepID=A0ABQ4SY38_9HYPH|nr:MULTISPECIES: maleylacetoacetate isomerase [Methylobacterium]PIU06153.1 MAG: maleylacetoacetate isomerase [Methylobacterium sp. CG09_land_8_20_14_0_10_71_15]PIU12023.1 MAG: maleylacetoacetate isomerase [Methylobacterium sp. CG08_land_8_20_14_0_20_71_15]GBU20009.1 maleylacetoacetate isomerase [Methylobacterium sp.]GJE07792.1 Maleylpyruvate isomerase [Methylobacterium jeotgali]
MANDVATPLRMYGNWRSAAAFRVRIALNLKGLPVEETFIDLDAGDQHKPEFRKINPQGAVPALFDGGGPPLTQSLAILDYLEDAYPAVPLLPAEPRARARARSLAQVVACDTHPLYVPRVRNYLMEAYGLPKERMMEFVRHVFSTGLKTLETRLSTEAGTGRFCQGDAVSHADLCLVSLWVGTGIFGVETAPYPTVARIAEDCLALEAFARAHPLCQPGAPQG